MFLLGRAGRAGSVRGMIARPRRRLGALLPLALSAAALLAPSAQAAPAERAYALTTAGTLLSFDPAAPQTVATTTITGVTAGENLVGIDVRPQNGVLYGLGVDATTNTATLYAISPETGFAGVVGAAPGVISFTNGVFEVDLPSAGYGFDFNPAADRVRVTTAQGLNFRVNPNTGVGVDGDNTGLTSGNVTGTNPDGSIVNTGNTVDGTAYTNNVPNNGNLTTLYTLSSTADQLAIQNPPNVGTQTLAREVTVGGLPLNFAGVGGFDIASGVNVASSNTAVRSGVGYAALTVGSVNRLYAIDLPSATATEIGTIGDGTLPIRGLALQRPLDEAGYPVVALNGSRDNLVRFQTATPGTSTTQALNTAGLAAGDTLVALSWRPQTGQLYGLGVNAVANTATLYLLDPQTGAVTAVGSAGQIAFTTEGATPIDFPDPTVVGWGIDFNPTVDRIRVVTGTGLNFRVNPNTGAPVDGNNGSGVAATGTNPDGSINGLDAGSFGVVAPAYTNQFVQPLTGGVTTQYVLEPSANKLYVQSPPNAGTVTLGRTVTLGGVPLDFTSIAALELPPEVRVTTSNQPATGTGVAVLTVAGVTGVYSLDLATTAARLLGPAPTSLTAFALGRAQPDVPDAQPTPPGPGPGGPPPVGPGGPAADRTAPVVTRLALAFARRKRVTISFRTSEAGTAAIRVLRETRGRRAGRRACRARARRGRRCTIRTSWGTVTQSVAAGAVTIRLAGRVGRRALPLGAVRIEVVVRDAAGHRSARGATSGRVKR